MKSGKFVFADQELILDEFELITLMKIVKNRNRKLYVKFRSFYESVIDPDVVRLFNKVMGLNK